MVVEPTPAIDVVIEKTFLRKCQDNWKSLSALFTAIAAVIVGPWQILMFADDRYQLVDSAQAADAAQQQVTSRVSLQGQLNYFKVMEDMTKMRLKKFDDMPLGVVMTRAEIRELTGLENDLDYYTKQVRDFRKLLAAPKSGSE